MNILYVAPRYHTNQIPIMEGWIAEGSQVKFVSQFSGINEDYSVVKPEIIGYSRIFEVFMSFYRAFFCRNEKSNKKEYDLRIKIGFPPLGKADKLISDFKPDMVILREKSIYNIPFSLSCKWRNIHAVLYNQSPLYKSNSRRAFNPIKSICNAILNCLLPSVRMTPVMGDSKRGVKCNNSIFVPFVAEPMWSPDNRKAVTSSSQDISNNGGSTSYQTILCISRYEERKNLLLLTDSLSKLKSLYNFQLVIAGELLDSRQKDYYNLLKKRLIALGLSDITILRKNCSRTEIFELYKSSDIFVLPSTRERASISQLEAMSCSLPVICSNTNGSACYVEHGVTGYLFEDNNLEDLTEKLSIMLSDNNRAKNMGANGYHHVCKKYQFSNYKDALLQSKTH